MLKTFILSASIVIGAFVPSSVEARSRCGIASFYGRGDGFAWRTMANGRRMNPSAMTAAHPSLPLGTRVHVTNQANGKTVLVTVSDRGPWYGGRILDLSAAAFARISSHRRGLASVCFAFA